VSAQLGRDLPAYGIHRGLASFSAATPSQELTESFTGAGAQIRHGRARLSLRMVGLDDRSISATPRPEIADHEVSYAYAGATAWYANGPLGVEQGITVTRRAAETTVAIRATGMTPHLTPSGIRFGTQLRYGDLGARDATGRGLHAWLTLARDGSTVLLHVDTAGARFPVRIDPLVQSATLEPASTADVDDFGVSVAVTGDLLVVGDPNVATSGATQAAYVFQQGPDGWSDATQVAQLTAATVGTLAPAGFGTAVSISPDGKVIAVGAPSSSLDGRAVGAVYTYDEPTSGGWVNASANPGIKPPGPSTGDEFGAALSLSDDKLLVGASGENSDEGAADLYSEPSGGWSTAPATPVEFAGTSTEELGDSVALSADDSTIVLGAPDAIASSESDAGEVEVLTEPPTGWSASAATADLTASDVNMAPQIERLPSGDDELGSSVAISSNDTTIAAGEPGQTEDANANDGAVDVFTEPSGGWTNATQSAELYDGDYSDATGEQLGNSITFAGSSVIAGDDGYGAGAGALYEFDEPSGGWSTDPSDAAAGPTFTGTTNSSYSASVASDGSTVVAGETGGDSPVGSALVYGYTAPGSVSTPTTPTQTPTTQTPAPTTTTPGPAPGSGSGPGPGPATPSSIDFSITPDAEPLLTGQQITLAATSPEAGVAYAWTFEDNSTAAGTTVTHTYTGAGVFTITLTESVNGQSVGSASHNVIVVQAQAPDADMTVLRSNQQGGNGASTAVTDPVTIVPAATLPEVDATAQDQVTVVDYWFDAQDAGSSPPDLTCLPDGTCGHFSGTGVPTDAQLTPVPGVTSLGSGAVYGDGSPTRPSACPTRFATIVTRTPDPDPACERYTPSSGFPTIQVNFWNAALAQFGGGTNRWASTPEIPVGPQREAVLVAGANGTDQVQQPAETVPYAPFSQLNLAQADGFEGEQGVPDTGCFPGDDYKPGDGGPCPDNAITWQSGPPAEAGGQLTTSGLFSTVFGPYDLSHFGVNSAEQIEDQANLLYNYATVVGVDTPIDDQFGPATGATEGAGHTTVPRTVTMIAYNGEGQASAPATEAVPLTPAATPSFSVCIEDVSGNTPCVIAPSKGPLPFTINTGDVLRFVLSGASGGDEPITRYAIAIGQPNTATVETSVGKTDQCGAPSEVGSWMHLEPTDTPTSTPTDSNTGGSTSSPTSHPIQTKSPASGPSRRSDANADSDLRTSGPGLSTSGATIPPFSDLLAGAFPPHDCEGYSERTVNAAGTPGAVPAQGPTVTLHADLLRAQAKTPIAPEPVVGDTYTDPGLATVAATTTPAPTVATGAATKSSQSPVLITSDPDKLDFSFAKDGTYSASVAAYNSAGLGAITRIDGFLAQPAAHNGYCVSVEHESLAIPVPDSHDARDVGFSGNCMTVIRDGSNDELYASTQAIDVDGVPVTPSPGDSIVISTDADTFYVAPCTITKSELNEQIGGPHGKANPCPDTHTGDLYLALGAGSSGGKALPGFARLTDFSTAKADAYLLPLTTSALPAVGSTPAAGTPQEKDAVGGCGLYGFSQPWPNSPGATYDGFGIASTEGPCVAFTTDHGDARVAFWDALPQGFSNGASPKPDSSQVVLYGSDMPAVSDLSYNPYASVASVTPLPKVKIAGDFPTLGALIRAQSAKDADNVRTADDDLPGFPAIPDCPPSTDGTSGLSIPQDTSLGPISMPVGASFCYIAKTGDFIGNVMVDIPGPLPINGVEVGFEIGHGRLIDAGGELSGNVPVFPGVFINDFKFDIHTDPTEVAAAITASIVDLLDVQGGVIIKPSLPEVDFEGNVAIAGVSFGNFDIDYTKQGVGMSVSFGKSFGPASLNISISGALSTSPPSFYLEGQGSACLFLCLNVEGLVSNRGLAACGSINLLLVDFSGGFAVLWSGPNSGVHLFTGCDLSPYIPANLADVKGAIRSEAPVPQRLPHDGAPPPQSVIAAGGSEQLPLHQSTMCPETFVPPTTAAPGTTFTPPAVPADCSTQTEAVQVHSLYNPDDPGATPLVSLTNASGDTRVPATPTTPGYWGLNATAAMSGGTASTADDAQTDGSTWLVDQNPVPTDDTVANSTADCATPSSATISTLPSTCPKVVTTTVYIGDPGPGNWTLNVLPGSAPVVDVTTADELPPLTPSTIGDTITRPVLSGSADTFKIKVGRTLFSQSAITAKHVLLAPSIERPEVTTADQLKLATDPEPADLDVPAIDAGLLRSINLKLPTDFSGTAAIIDQGSGCTATCSQVLASGLSAAQIPAGGMPLLFEPITAGRTQTIKAFISNSEGMPSRVVTLTTFRSPSLPRPEAPKILTVTRDGSVVHVFVNVENTPLTGSIALALSAGNGCQYDQSFELDAAQPGHVTPVDTSPMTGIGAARRHSIYEFTLSDVDPTRAVKVAVAGLNDGAVGRSSGQQLDRAPLTSLDDRQLLAKLHMKLR
jgi:hypothetical protein